MNNCGSLIPTEMLSNSFGNCKPYFRFEFHSSSIFWHGSLSTKFLCTAAAASDERPVKQGLQSMSTVSKLCNIACNHMASFASTKVKH